MIGKLKGVIDSYGEDWVIIDVGGVGYHVFCSAKTHAALPPTGEAARLFTEMLVSDSAIRLVGFATQGERDWFRLLESVQGVGTKVALAILSVLTTSELTNAIALADTAMVGRANGVGKKLAQRIVAEMKDKAPALSVAGLRLPGAATDGGAVTTPDGDAAAEAMSALTNLGYQPVQASAAVAAAMKELGEDADTAKLIRRGLKELAR